MIHADYIHTTTRYVDFGTRVKIMDEMALKVFYDKMAGGMPEGLELSWSNFSPLPDGVLKNRVSPPLPVWLTPHYSTRHP